MYLSIILNAIVYVLCDGKSIDNYYNKRSELLETELLMSVGGRTYLSEKEMTVNNCLMQYKNRELNYGFENPEYFNFSRHYFNYKNDMRKSKVYQILKSMPKGAALHIHDMAVLDPDYLMRLTYMKNLYVCFDSDQTIFKFSNNIPLDDCEPQWQYMSDARKSATNLTKFDNDLRKQLTIVVNRPDAAYPSIKESWQALRRYFRTVHPLLQYRPIWEQYIYDSLKKFKEDNVMYVELRSAIGYLYELDGTELNTTTVAKIYQNTIKRFLNYHPDFFGAKVIFAPSRKISNENLEMRLQTAIELKNEMPDLIAGFDLVGQEDLGRPLVDFVSELQSASKDLNYFFHAGETDWLGTSTDENLVDAILLGTKRIGHAYALSKHPLLMRKVVQDHICLEVNVISNAVLSLVRDVRNHPLNIFLAHNLSVVLSSDDPGAWEADALTDDFYVTFVGVVSKHADLRLLKQLALNSLVCSSLSEEKSKAIDSFNKAWNNFIDNFKC